MRITTRRQRISSSGRWSETDRNRLWQLRNENLELTWVQFQKDVFPDRSVTALCKAYSDMKLQRRRRDKSLMSNMSKATIATSLNKDNKRTLDDQETANGFPQKLRKVISDDVHWSPSDADDDDDDEDDEDEDEDEDANDNSDTDSDLDRGDIQVNGETTTRLLRRTPKKLSNTDPHRGLSTSPAVERQPRVLILPVTVREKGGRTPTEQAGQATILPPEKPAGAMQTHRAPSILAPNNKLNSPAPGEQDSPKPLPSTNGRPPPAPELRMPPPVNLLFTKVPFSDIIQQVASNLAAYEWAYNQVEGQAEEITRLQKGKVKLESSQNGLKALLKSKEEENALQKNHIQELLAKLAEQKSAAVPVPKCEECVKKDEQIAKKDQLIALAKERQKQLQTFTLFDSQ